MAHTVPQKAEFTPDNATRPATEVSLNRVGTDIEAPLDAKTEKRAKSVAGKVGLSIVALLFSALLWHLCSDLYAPASATGSVTALTALVAPRVAGQVDQVMVADNQQVKAGDPLFNLDPKPFELAIRQAEANLAQVTQTVDASVVSLASTDAKVVQARSALVTATAANERAKTLFQKGLNSQAQLDTATAQLAAATSALQSAEADTQSARVRSGAETTKNPQVDLAEVQLEQARLNLSFATVVAPSDGVVTNLKLASGQYINAGSPALTFIESNSLWVVVDLRENQLANVQVGDDASVLFDGAPGRSFDGKVRSIAWGIDTGRTAANGLPQNQALTRWFEPARTIPVHIALTASDAWPANVRVGSKASALVFAEGRNNPVALVSRGLQTLSSYFSFMY